MCRILIVVPLLVMSAGCWEENAPVPRQAVAQTAPVSEPRRPSPPQPESAADADVPAGGGATTAPVTPADTVRRVNELRQAGRLREMAEYVVKDHRPDVVELVRAVDQLLLDNLVLKERIKASGHEAVATLFNRSEVANIIGVFSHDVQIIREQVTGDSAEVTIQVGERLPLTVVRLSQHDGRWLIQLDPPIPGLTNEIRNLGKALRRAAQTVKQRQDMTAEEIKKETEFWQAPVLRRIKKLVEEARHGQG